MSIHFWTFFRHGSGGCGHEHQNQSKSNNYQSAPLPITNHIDWTQRQQKQKTQKYAWNTKK